MSFSILDGTGSGNEAKVDVENRLHTTSVSQSNQHHVSISESGSYQVSGEISIGTSDTGILYLENTSDTHDLVVTFIRVMSIGAAAASSAAYFTLNVGGSYTSGGAAIVPTNMKVGSSTTASATAYDGTTPLVLANFTEIDRNYEANSMQSYNKDGSIVLGKGNSIAINHKGSTVAGEAYARISFYFEKDL